MIIDGAVAFIAGGAGGFGAATARRLHARMCAAGGQAGAIVLEVR
jgi:NAD(P)-dependent dehydrogenase (short-subunit alcohol dehydrogenase family)